MSKTQTELIHLVQQNSLSLLAFVQQVDGLSLPGLESLQRPLLVLISELAACFQFRKFVFEYLVFALEFGVPPVLLEQQFSLARDVLPQNRILLLGGSGVSDMKLLGKILFSPQLVLVLLLGVVDLLLNEQLPGTVESINLLSKPLPFELLLVAVNS